MSTDNVLMHNTDMEREGGRQRERWILQTGLFLDSERGETAVWECRRRDDNSGRRGGICRWSGEGKVFPELGK